MDITPKRIDGTFVLVSGVWHHERIHGTAFCGHGTIMRREQPVAGHVYPQCGRCAQMFREFMLKPLSTLDLPMSEAPPLYGIGTGAEGFCLVAATSEQFDRGRFAFCGRPIAKNWMPQPLTRSSPLCDACAIVAVEIAHLARGPALPKGWVPK